MQQLAHTIRARYGQPNVQYVFWSGGYSSTFRILQILVEGSDMIQPIFLSSPSQDTGELIGEMSKFYDDNKKIINGRLLPLWHILCDATIDDVVNHFGFPMQDCSDYLAMQSIHNVLICAEKGRFQINMRIADVPACNLAPQMRYPCAYLTRRKMRKYARRHGFSQLLARIDQ